MAEIGVDAFGESDVDDAVLAGEGDGWLGAIAGEGEEPFAGTTGKQDAKRISHILRLRYCVGQDMERTT
jgi:hypothetical protein